MARASSVRNGVHTRRRCAKVVVFFCAFVAALCVVAFPGVVVVAALKTSDDESFGDTTTTHVSGEKMSSSKSFIAFATPASKGLSANSLEVRTFCCSFSRSMHSACAHRRSSSSSSSPKRRDARDFDEPRLSRGGIVHLDVRARSLFSLFFFCTHRPRR